MSHSTESQQPEPIAATSPTGGTKSSVAKIVVVVAVVGAAVALQPWKLIHSKSTAAEVRIAAEESAEPKKTVQVERPAATSLSEVVLPTTLRPWQSATLNARVSGYLTAWHKDLGARVTAGEVLAEIETPELDQQLAEAQATAAEAIAAVVQSQAERQEAEAELNVAEAQVHRAKADAELATSQLARREKLLPTNAISQEEYVTFQKLVQARDADVAAAQADVERRRMSLTTKAAMITAREAAAKSRQANVERLNETLRFKKITAPFDGVITSRTAEVGMLVTAGKEALFVLEDMTKIRAQTNVPQAFAVQAGIGTKVSVRVPEAGLVTTATVTRTAESIDPVSRTMLAEVELENSSRRFQPGSYAQSTFSTKQGDAAWTIPSNTLQMRVEGPHVAVVNERNRIELRPVKLGRDLGKRIIVASGLSGQERLVVNPDEELRSGLAVRVVESKSAAPATSELTRN